MGEFRDKVESKELREGLFPAKVVDFNKLPKKEEFWDMQVGVLGKRYGLKTFDRMSNPTISDVLFWLNMAATNWKEDVGGRK